jgi:predicted peptidase
MSPERLALIEDFKKVSEGLEKKYEVRSHKSDRTMPYRLFRPNPSGKLPLVLYLHGSGGMGDDNQKQLGLGNIFGTRVWLLPENQKQFPCYVVVPQTDRGWVRYDLSQEGSGPAKVLPGLGDGARLALEIVSILCHEFPIDEHRIYVTGQSMGGAGTWHLTAQRPKLFAAAAACCPAETSEDAIASLATPLWNFHGPIMMTALVACLGLLPAALSTGIGSSTQKPFAIVIVAGLVSRLFLGFFVNPVLYEMVARDGDVLQV